MASTVASVLNGATKRACVVLLGDAQPLFRSGMRYLLQDNLMAVEVVEAGSRAGVLALLEQGSFGLVLTSLFSAEGDPQGGFLGEVLQRAPAGRLMILSSLDEPSLIRRALAAGAAGYVLKDTAPDITLHAIRLVLAGGVYVPPAALGPLPRATAPDAAPDAAPEALPPAPPEAPPEAPPPAPADGVPLTDRQDAVLSLLMEGTSNKGIARSLDLSAGTVKSHVASLLRLYGAGNRTELVHAATRRAGVVAREAGGPGARSLNGSHAPAGLGLPAARE